MAVEGVCTPEFGAFFNSTVLPLMAYAGILSSMVVGLAYGVGHALANPKLTEWSKTEVVQLFVSIFSAVFIIATLNSFCSIDMASIGSFAGVSTKSQSIYGAANDYLYEAGIYSHNSLIVTRYHLESYTVLSYFNAFVCDYTTGTIGWGCFFGYSGQNQQPFGGYGAHIAALNIAFSSNILGLFSTLNSLFILNFIFKGMVMIFLPLGIFLRSMPFLRTFGGVFIALVLSFLFIYPLVLGIFYLAKDAILDAGNNNVPKTGGVALDSYLDETKITYLADARSAGESLQAVLGGPEWVKKNYFPDGDNFGGVLLFSAYSFVAAVMLPTIALLASIASVSYISRFYGEEIDLSRITQMV